MIRKFLLLTPIISSLIFASPAGAAVDRATNLKMLDEINVLVAQIGVGLNELKTARENQKLRDPRDNPEIDGPDGLIGKMESRLGILRSNLSVARGLAPRAEEIQPLNSALRNATSILGEAQIFLRDTTLGDAFKNPVRKIINILETGGLLDKLRTKLNVLGSVGYRVSISGHTQDVIVDVGGQPVIFKSGETTKIVTLPSRLPSEAAVRISALLEPAAVVAKSIVVSRAPSIVFAPNCVTDTKMSFTLSISSGSAIISGGRGKIEVDEKQYTPEILFADALENNPEIFESNKAVGVVAKNTLRKLPSAMMFTHTASGVTADLYVASGRQVKKFVIRRDSVENLNAYYEARDLKNLDKIFLLGQSAEGASARSFLSQFSNLSESAGYPVLIAPQSGGAGLLAKTNQSGDYLKIADLAGEKISFAYASKNGKLAIVISSDDLTRGSVERIIGPVTKEKSEYRMGLKAFTQGLWRIAAHSRGMGGGIRLISLAFAQPTGGGGNEGDGEIYIEAPTIAYDPPPSFEPAPSPSEDGLSSPVTPVTPPQVTPPAGASTGRAPSRPPRETGIDYAVGLAVKITEKGVSVQLVDPESKNWDPYAEYPGGGPTCGKDFKTPGLGVKPEDLDGGGGLEPPPKSERSLLERLFNPSGEDTVPVPPVTPTTDEIRGPAPQIQTPGIFQRFFAPTRPQPIITPGYIAPTQTTPGLFQQVRDFFQPTQTTQ